MTYFPIEVFSNIMGFCDDTLEVKQKKLWNSIKIIRKENYDASDTPSMDWMRMEIVDHSNIEWTQENINTIKPIKYISWSLSEESKKTTRQLNTIIHRDLYGTCRRDIYEGDLLAYEWQQYEDDMAPQSLLNKDNLTKYLENKYVPFAMDIYEDCERCYC